MLADSFTRMRISPWFHSGWEVKELNLRLVVSFLSPPSPPPAPPGLLGLVGSWPSGCQSPSVNKALIGCCPVRSGPPEKSNYWLRGFKAAPGRLMKGDKLGTVSRIPAGRPRQPGSGGAAESPWIKGIRRERGKRADGRAGLAPRGPRWPGVGAAGGDSGISRPPGTRPLRAPTSGTWPGGTPGKPRLRGPGWGRRTRLASLRSRPGTLTSTGWRPRKLGAAAAPPWRAGGRRGARHKSRRAPEIRLARVYSLGRGRLN